MMRSMSAVAPMRQQASSAEGTRSVLHRSQVERKCPSVGAVLSTESAVEVTDAHVFERECGSVGVAVVGWLGGKLWSGASGWMNGC